MSDPAPAASPALAASGGRALPAGRLLAALGIVVALVLIYHRTGATLWQVWTTNENYSHGPLVPLVAAWLVWLRRAELRATRARGDARGLALVALACATQVVGIRADLFALQGYSFVLLLLGLSVTFLGPGLTRGLAFPILYLVFMLTFPPILMNRLSFALKEITVRLSARLAEAFGAVLQRNGMTLYLLSGELRIENPCSGLRSLLALLATGAVFAYLQRGAWWRRGILFLAAIPIAMAGNAVRITLLIVVGHYAGVRAATGRLHEVSGYLIYAVALTCLFAVRALLTPRPARTGGTP
jgi:exosortase